MSHLVAQILKAGLRQQTKQIDTWSVRVDVPPPDGMPPVFSLMLANRYAEFLGDTATIEGLRKRFEALTGPVRKTGGVR